MSPRASRSALAHTLGQLRKNNPALADRWHELAVCPARFDVRAAAAVWGIDDATARGHLAALTARGLLDHDAAAATYDMPAGLREHAAGRPPRDDVRMRHAQHYLQVADAADALYYAGHENMVAGLRLFDAAWPHLAAAWAWLRGREDRAALRWLSDLPALTAYVHDVRLSPQRQIPMHEAALAAAIRLADRPRQVIHLGNLGVAHKNAGEPRRAIGCYEQQLALVRQLADRHGEANALGNLGVAHAELGEWPAAVAYYERALALGRELGDRRGEGNALGSLGSAVRAQGDPRRAIELHEQALAIYREIGDRRNEAACLGNLGNAYDDLGDSARARDLWEAARRLFAELGDPRAAQLSSSP